jgi:hypothetical protein
VLVTINFLIFSPLGRQFPEIQSSEVIRLITGLPVQAHTVGSTSHLVQARRLLVNFPFEVLLLLT